MRRRDELIERILSERGRQFNLPGSEWDAKNTPNDWVSIASHYLGEEVRRGRQRPTRDLFEDALVKAAAVILAALEHTPLMQRSGYLDPPLEDEPDRID
jgi:hypothetical protein